MGAKLVKSKNLCCQLIVFPSLSLLKMHIKSVHERIKAFKCNICDYETPKNDILKEHIVSVHEVKNNCKEIEKYIYKIKPFLFVFVFSGLFK